MNNPLDGLLERLLTGFASGLHIEGDTVRLNLIGPASDFELRFTMPKPEVAARIKEREGSKYAIPVGIALINRKSGKDVRGFHKTHINAWWLRTFVYEVAAAVAYMEREWDVLSPEYIAMMAAQEAEDDE